MSEFKVGECSQESRVERCREWWRGERGFGPICQLVFTMISNKLTLGDYPPVLCSLCIGNVWATDCMYSSRTDRIVEIFVPPCLHVS
jgi:hypothetical protein